MRASPRGRHRGFRVVGRVGPTSGTSTSTSTDRRPEPRTAFVPTSSLAFSAGGAPPRSSRGGTLAVRSQAIQPRRRDHTGPDLRISGVGAGREPPASTTGVASPAQPCRSASQSVVLTRRSRSTTWTMQVAGAGPVTIEMTTSATGSLGAGLRCAHILRGLRRGRNNALQFSRSVNGVERLSRNTPDRPLRGSVVIATCSGKAWGPRRTR